MAALPVAQDGGENPERCRAVHGDLQLADVELERPPDDPSRSLGVREGCLSLAQQLVAGGRQPHTAGEAFEQRAAELSLERADLLGEGGLGHEQPFGGLRQRARLGDRHEVLKLAEVHAESISSPYRKARKRV